MGRRPGRVIAAALLAACALAGCSNSGRASLPTTPPTATPTTAPVTSTTTPGPQTSGSRTVLSPTGLNVRGSPSPTAPVLGSAAQGTVLTVLGYSGDGGGWFKVKGATVTGWISAQETLSGPGEFHYYTSSAFNALYPADWSQSTLAGPTPGVSFRPGLGAGDIVVIPAGSVSQLPQGRTGYGRTSVTQVVVCGVTAGLVVFQRQSPTSPPATSVPESLTYLAEVRFAVDAQHALGFYADTPDLGATFTIFKELLASATFSSPQCSG